MARDVLSVEVEGAGSPGEVARDFDAAKRQVQNEINRTMRILERVLPNVVKPYVPADTGAMRDSLRAILHFRASRVRLTLRVAGEREGYNYVRTTREGHRTPVILPTRAKKLRIPIGGRRSGSAIFRGAVRGYDPPYDWGAVAAISADAVVDIQTRDLGRRVEVAVLSSARSRR